MIPNPDSSSRARVEELLAGSRTCELSRSEREELNVLLRADAMTRHHAARWLLDDAALTEELRAEQVERLFHDGSVGEATPVRHGGWPQWRPLTAAAAGLVFGMLCASVAWAYAGGRVLEIFERIVPMANGDFENATPPAPDGMPTAFGVWSGDFARLAGAGEGIQPKSGQRMLRVLRSDSRTDPPGLDSHGGDMMQLVDLRPFKADFASGNAVLEVSASGNMIAGQPADGFSFAVSAQVFSGRPEELSTEPSERAQAALASGQKRLLLDAEPATWQTVTARLLLPADADFVLVKLTVTRRAPHSPGHVEFDGHYLDDVKVALKTQPAQPVRIVSR